MANRYGRHYIVGNEADQPRPMVYLHAGWRQRRFNHRRRGPSLRPLALVGVALLALGLRYLIPW